MTNKHRSGIESRNSRNGFLFVLPWTIGIILFFIIPLLKSLWFAFASVKIGETGGLITRFNYFKEFKYLFTEDPKYVDELRSSLISFGYSLPIILILSLVFALILVQNFRGRLVARAIFFLPVIIASGVVITLMNTQAYGQPVALSVTGEGNNYTNSMMDFNKSLHSFGLSAEIIRVISEYVGRVFALIWSMGVQVILFISGLQTIPKQLYEVSTVEGASKWEEFWFVTVPMLKNIILLVMSYTMVELFLASENPVMIKAYDLMKIQVYDRSSTILWIYFAIIMAIAGIVFAVYNNRCLKKWN